jgi:hypothetical protein
MRSVDHVDLGKLLWCYAGVMSALRRYALGQEPSDRVVKPVVRFLLGDLLRIVDYSFGFGFHRECFGVGQFTLACLPSSAAIILVQLGVEMGKPL